MKRYLNNTMQNTLIDKNWKTLIKPSKLQIKSKQYVRDVKLKY